MCCLRRPPWGIRSLPCLSCISILGMPQFPDPVRITLHRPAEHLIFCGSHRHLRFKRVTPTTLRTCCICYAPYPEGTTVSQSAARPRARAAALTPPPCSFPAQQKPTWSPKGPVGHPAGVPSWASLPVFTLTQSASHTAGTLCRSPGLGQSVSSALNGEKEWPTSCL